MLFAASQAGNAQKTDHKKIMFLTGTVRSIETNRPIAFAHVIDINNRSVTVTDTMGVFGLTILKGDTLRISSIGFDIYYFSLADSSVTEDEYSINIEMFVRSYNLSEVNIYRMRWAEFEFEFLNTELEENETGDKLNKTVFTDFFREELQHIKLSQSAGVLLAFDVPNWKSRSRAKVKKMEEEDEFQKLIDAKYNEKLVSKITGLNNTELVDFINFCRLDPIYIINTTDYEIVNRIKSLYHTYKSKP